MVGDERERIDTMEQREMKLGAEAAELKERSDMERRNDDHVPVFIGLRVFFEQFVDDIGIGCRFEL